ncbi:MAG: hypothetical protein SFW36_16660 [Leptolyngbyaceae cyanobacterium bins.59]|nr:hypothetical protein [Leptolyngbyaceae cyanobacterium bins.59]
MSQSQKMTDRLFAKALETLSAQNTLFFTSKQLAYFVGKRSKTVSVSGMIAVYVLSNFIFLVIGGIGSENSIHLSFPPLFWIWNCFFILFVLWKSQSKELSRLERRTTTRSLQMIGGLQIILAGVLIFFREAIPFSRPSALPLIALGIAAIGLGTWQIRRQSRLPQDLLFPVQTIEGWLTQWQQVNGAVKRLPPALPQPNGTVNSEITNYSFDRLVVCDRSVIAQLLIANNFHFENNCAVLSINGYPQNLFDTVMAMLRQNPDLRVYVLHDCSPSGLQVMHQLKNSENWFRNQAVAIVDIGLLPRQIFKLRDAVILQSASFAKAAQQLPAEIRQSLSSEELKWLDAGCYVELESFTPQRLIQVLNRGIAGSRDIGTTEGGDLILIGDSGVYASDSFG